MGSARVPFVPPRHGIRRGCAPLERRVGAALLVLLASGSWGGAFAAQQAEGDPVAGQRLARQVCAECHAVEADQVALIGPRSFLEIAIDPHTTEPGLRLFLRSPHVFMPNFILTEEQIGDVVAYILSLEAEEAAE